MKPHKHANLIKAWADGAEIEFHSHDDVWFLVTKPEWDIEQKYRIKPEPKPDEWSYLICNRSLWIEVSSPPMRKDLCENLMRLRRDGETLKIKSVEVLI